MTRSLPRLAVLRDEFVACEGGHYTLRAVAQDQPDVAQAFHQGLDHFSQAGARRDKHAQVVRGRGAALGPVLARRQQALDEAAVFQF